MKLFLGQDYAGNVYVTDDKDTLPPDLRDFTTVELRIPTGFFSKRTCMISVSVSPYEHAGFITRDPEFGI